MLSQWLYRNDSEQDAPESTLNAFDRRVTDEDKDILEDLIIASINQAQKKVDEISKSKLGSISGGLPGMPGF